MHAKPELPRDALERLPARTNGLLLRRLWPRLRRRFEDLIAWLRGAPPDVIDGSYSNASSVRGYRLYRPGWRHLRARPLVVMLHGCYQNADDFAAGTRPTG